jgi:hypothetical protein
MKITSYGLFWRASEIDWSPGRGNRDSFRLLGRIGAQAGKIRICNFRRQQGIYILYDDYGPTYVGLTRARGLGLRLKDHLSDRHGDRWDRFSWFGFTAVSAGTNEAGLQFLEEADDEVTSSTWTTIGDLEALLIAAMGTRSNRAQMKFADAARWTQIEYDECDKYLARLQGK